MTAPEDSRKESRPTAIIPYAVRWEQAANLLARRYAPPITPCQRCDYPVVHGYWCTFCGSWPPEDAA